MNATTSPDIGVETGLITAATYPIYAPYKRTDETGDEPQLIGKSPRIMSIITNTLILTGSPCWDPETRTLRFGHAWQRLATRLKLVNGGASREVLINLLEAYRTAPYPTEDGDIIIAEDAATDPDLTTLRRWIRFTPEYVDLIETSEPKEVPLTAVPGPAIDLDLLVLAALYTPGDRRLVIPSSALTDLLPGGNGAIKNSRYVQAAKHLNDSQSKWSFRYEMKSLIVTPRNADPDGKGLVMRVY